MLHSHDRRQLRREPTGYSPDFDTLNRISSLSFLFRFSFSFLLFGQSVGETTT